MNQARGSNVIVMSWPNRDAIYTVDLTSGVTKGPMSGGSYPMPIPRPTRDEVLISGRIGGAHSLWTMDAATLEIKRETKLRNRVDFTIFAPGMTLSQDEQFLYYLQRRPCTPGPFCDDYSVGVIDLRIGVETAEATLPRNGGFALLTPIGGAGMLAMCPTVGELYEASPQGVSTLVAFFPRAELPEIGGRGYRAWPIYAGATGEGHFYMVFEHGVVEVRDSQGSLQFSKRLLDGSVRFNGIERAQGHAHEVILGFSRTDSHSHGAESRGVVRFDPRDLSVTRLRGIPTDSISFTPVAGGRVAALERGRIAVVDINSGSRTADPVVTVPSDCEWIIGASSTSVPEDAHLSVK